MRLDDVDDDAPSFLLPSRCLRDDDDDITMADALLHSSAVYFYAYDPHTRAYTQLSDSVVGCALLAGASETDATSTTPALMSPFKLLFYNAQKQPLLQLAVTASSPTCTPQQDHYVNFLDDATQQFYSLRFKDSASVTAFLSAVAFAKAQVLATTATTSSLPIVLVDELALGKDDSKKPSAGLAVGDAAGIAFTRWSGNASDTSAFFSDNPLAIANQQATEVVGLDGDLKRVRLIEPTAASDDDASDALLHALATQALADMHKHDKRLVTVVTPQQWTIATIELVKVKKAASRASAAQATTTLHAQPIAPATTTTPSAADVASASASVNDELVQRMANLSRAGSKGSGLIASLSARNMLHDDASDASAHSRATSFADAQAAIAQTYVPVLLPGVQLPGDRKPSVSFATSGAGSDESAHHESNSASTIASHESLAATVLAPLKDTTGSSSSSASRLSSEMAQLMQEQSDLALLRQQLEESKRRLQDDSDADARAPAAAPASRTQSTSAPSAHSSFSAAASADPATSSGFSPWQPPSSAATFTPSASLPSRWDPTTTALDIIHSSSFQPPSLPFQSSYQPPPSLANGFAPSSSASSTAFTPSRSLVPSPALGLSSTGSIELESSLLRLQRSSTSVESTLQDLQAKVDRLLNAQSGLKTSSKYTPSASTALSSSGLFSSSATSPAAGLSSTAMLLKQLERALTQRDQLQDQHAQLQSTREQLEATVDELQQQTDALQSENRSLLEKLQSGQHLQHESFRLDMRALEAQLRQAQEHARASHEENARLRSLLTAQDEQLRTERAARQDDARTQRDAITRQVEAQVRQDARAAVDKAERAAAALEAQVAELTAREQQAERERETLTTQLRQAQTQLLDERTRAQSTQDARTQELETLVAQLQSQTRTLSEQVESARAETWDLEQLVAVKEQALTQLHESQSAHDAAALRELLKESMNDLYFHFQDAFEDESEFTGREVVLASRKILKQNTIDILAKVQDLSSQSSASAQ